MKLISEFVDQDIRILTESTKDGKKSYVIEGIFMMADTKNRNGRVYESKVMKPAIEKYVREQVNTGRAVGELNHPDGPTINLDKVSHRITSLKIEGSNVVGRAQILDTPMGKIVQGLLEGGVKLGVSSRGMGSLEHRESAVYVGSDFQLTTVDIVQDPSAPEAFVNGIMEGVEYVWDNGILKAQQIEAYETEIKKARGPRQIAESQARVFADFLSKIKL